ATHGGDGNSGECDSLAETSADEPRDGKEGQGSADQGANKDTPDGQSHGDGGRDGLREQAARSASRDSSSRKGEGTPTGQGDGGCDEQTGETGTYRDGTSHVVENGCTGDAAPTHGDDEATNADTDATPSPQQQHHNPDSGTGAAKRGREGDVGAPRAASIPGVSKDDVAHARRLVAALDRLVRDVARQASPRIDGRALVKEMSARRYALHRAHRRESGVGSIVIAVDTSESTHSWHGPTLAAAVAVAKAHPHVQVFEHCNGGAWAWLAGRRDKRIDDAIGAPENIKAWELVAATRPSVILALGDDHDHECLQAAAKRGVTVIKLRSRAMYIDPKHSRLRYRIVDGVKDAATAAEAISTLSL
ncbi:MAG: hypothetical protein NNA22_11260, partial [Nitrospira sp.]|nr:hypothetical protein [Nitrospira sp.]